MRRPQLDTWQRSRGLSLEVSTAASLCSTRLPSTTLLQGQGTTHMASSASHVRDSPEGDVLPVHPGGGAEGDVELRAVSVATVVGHTQHSRAGVSNRIALVCGQSTGQHTILLLSAIAALTSYYYGSRCC